MDDWDAFDPDLHTALNASLTPPADDTQMQPVGTAHPAGSETTVQFAHQVHVPTQAQAGTSQQTVQQGTFRFEDAPMFPHVQQAHGSVHQAQISAQQVQPPPVGHSGDAVDSTAGSNVTFRPTGARGSSSGPNGGGTPPFSSFPAGSH